MLRGCLVLTMGYQTSLGSRASGPWKAPNGLVVFYITIKYVLNSISGWQIVHVRRETNATTHALTKLALQQVIDKVWIKIGVGKKPPTRTTCSAPKFTDFAL
jgi:hypothetical protein